MRRRAHRDPWAAVLAQPRVQEALRAQQEHAAEARAARGIASAAAVEVPAGPRMTKTEERYFMRLRAEGQEPRFAAITLCLTSGARRVRYTPDAVVVAGEIELHEVKGGYVWEDARLKFQVAVEEWGHVFTFVWAQWRGAEWSIRRYPRRSSAAGEP